MLLHKTHSLQVVVLVAGAQRFLHHCSSNGDQPALSVQLPCKDDAATALEYP